jgi:protein-S-isoprenylcysteine O-methyltransferase Ste14
MQKYFSLIVLFLFIALVAGRVLMLRKKGIKAFVFAETDKSDLLLVPVLLFFFYTILASVFDLPLPDLLKQPFWPANTSSWFGLALCLTALTGLAATLISFGNSFRVGIDEKTPDKLITGGLFSISRNPIYVCFLLFFLGAFLTTPNLMLICIAGLFALAIHRQVLREEAFLKTHYGQEYEAYCRRVRRYL